MDNTLLNTYDLTVGYIVRHRPQPVLGNLTLDLRQGELVSILGSNGIGKSTLLRTITGLQPPLSGTVEITGIPVQRMSRQLMAKTIAIVHTDRTMAGGLSVSELVGLGRQPYTGFFGRLDKADRAIVDKALDSVGMSRFADRYVATLSDGERQKVMIARALAQSTPIIILDEPTSFLDVASRIETMSLLHDLARQQGKAILLSSHDVTQALTLSDRLWVIDGDRHVESGTPAYFLSRSTALNAMFPDRKVCFNPSLKDFEATDQPPV